MRQTIFIPLILLFFSVPALAQRGYDRGAEEIQCTSRDYRQERCNVDWRDARVARQLSNTRCERGRTWDLDRRGLWVDGGCSAVFVEAGGGRNRNEGNYRGGGGGGQAWSPGHDWDRSIRVRCESRDYNYQMCRVDTGRGSAVSVDSQMSNTRCVEGRNWGWNRAGIWVNGGCAAVFRVDRRWR